MTAKIKDRNKHSSRHGHRHKPRGITDKSFERVYWPFIPVILAILLPMVLASGALKHPFGRVLSYAVTTQSQTLLLETNTERQKNGEQPLKINDELSTAAQSKARDMAARNYWSHNTPEGIEPWAFVSNVGYTYQKLGENLAAGFSNDNDVVKAWMASPHHRDNILDADFTEVGFGYANSPNYTASGGSPTTIVVAFYGHPAPATAVTTASHISLLGTNNTASTPTAGNSLAATTKNAQLSTTAKISTWLPLIMSAGFVIVCFVWFQHHFRAIRKFIRNGERYAMRHPATELGLVTIAFLIFVMIQTVGYIQ